MKKTTKKGTNAAPKNGNGKKKVTFTLNTATGCKVFVAGSFNNWQHRKKELKDRENSGNYECTVLLSPGVHEYKFIIDDAWCIDPENQNFKPNNMGTLNSIICVE